MSHQQNPEHQRELERQQIIEEARASLEAYRRLIAEAGLSPSTCLDALRRAEGAAAVKDAHRQADEVVRLFEEQTALYAMHASRAERPVSRRVAGRRII